MKNTLLTIALLSVVYLSLTSSSTGPSNSSADPAQSGCGSSSCHGTIVDTTVLYSIQFVDKSTGLPVTNGKYILSHTYTITIAGTYSGASDFGFALTARQPYYIQMGTFSNPSSGTKLTSLGNGLTVFESASLITAASGSFSASVDWTAPSTAIGVGGIAFNTSILAGNGNSVADAGDRYMTYQAILETIPTGVDKLADITSVNVYPNPAVSILNVNINNPAVERCQYVIYDAIGTICEKGILTAGDNSISVSSLSSGLHFIQLNNGSGQKNIRFNKL